MNKSQFTKSIQYIPTVILEEIYDFGFLNNIDKNKLFKELVLGNIQGQKWAMEINHVINNKDNFMNFAMISQKIKILGQRHCAIVFGYKYIIYMPNIEQPFVVKRVIIAYE